ncbi:MAG: hypothetical protein H6824_12415 [Planctomycetaceae bacterium]|nr:hypothetical protein [Planctomycetaceae bacterium]
MFDKISFPRLTPENHQQTSNRDVKYNCIAWAAGDVNHWWEPGRYWPVDIARDEYGIGALEAAFASLGYAECPDGSLEAGFEKVALYGSGFMYTHAARQLPDGTWTSKLGKSEDISHDLPEDVAGGMYGEVVQFMRRPITRR